MSGEESLFIRTFASRVNVQPPDTLPSSNEKQKNALKPTRQATLGAWLCGIVSLGLTWGQSWWYVFHPHYFLLSILFVGLAGSTCVALAFSLRQIVRGPHRIHAMIFAVVAMLPVGFWAIIGIAAQGNWDHRWVPNTLTMRLAKVLGVTFMRAEVDLEYRHRLETQRLVMFYDHLDNPAQDLAAMDRHVTRLEDLLGGTLQTKVFWIRGSLPRIGVSGLSVHGLALGSDSSPTDWNGDEGRFDRHELAHAALDWFRVPGSDPPYVLHEGWAEAQSRRGGTLELAQLASNSRLENPSIGIRKLLGPDWYYRDAGPVYSIGGAFVDFLIRTRGAARFLRFYTGCRPDTVEASCRVILQTDLDTLEADFWDDVQQSLQKPRTTK